MRHTRGVNMDDALDYAGPIRRGTLATVKADGRPQLSNIMFGVGDDRAIRISLTATRAKTANILRDPRVCLHVTAPDFWSYVVIEADAALSSIATQPDDATVDELVALYRAMSGEHPDWQEYRRAMVADQRLIARLTPTRCYGSLPRSG
jgi:PPOX class probable F420-dependent enzyme